ncbi:hypothetical protein O6H91_01G156200 [Diphasiastrum complanatum]|uniref:Uncharacterized protein n=2 Tax=Diphasiastrum complanatum TaxID=34168 RepID=A0ACC2EXS5_DIPCM|nr:hypothetical protein O6H91_01G156200 [Diphasiastrum complanatum]
MGDISLLKLTALILIPVNLACFRLALSATLQSDVDNLRQLQQIWPTAPLDWHGDDPCGLRWRGVGCTAQTKYSVVTELSLSGMINGTLPSLIGNLVNLQYLELSYNDFQGGIPTDLGKLANLQFLSLQVCGLTGSIPSELGNLSKLEFLALNGNQLIGGIPHTLGYLQVLYWLDFSENLLSGPLPVSTRNDAHVGLDNLTSLLHFHMNNNSLSGAIPVEIQSLKLVHLFLDSNSFSGRIPPEIGNLSALQYLRLDYNYLLGEIPSSISNITTLQELHLNDNGLTSHIPDLSALSNLQFLDLSSNNFSPERVPAWFSNISQIRTLIAENCSLIGLLRANGLNGTLQFPTQNISSQLIMVSLEWNNITSINQVPYTPNFKYLLEGNPVCNNIFNTSDVCNTQATDMTMTWKSPTIPSCTLRSCEQTKTLNPLLCTCVYPFTCTIQFHSPPFYSLDDSKITALGTALWSHLSLNSTQVWVESANITDKHRLKVNVLFFPAGNAASLNYDEESYIMAQMHSPRLLISDFGPYLLIHINRPLGPTDNCAFANNSTCLSTKRRLLIPILLPALTVAVMLLVLISWWYWRLRRPSVSVNVINCEVPVRFTYKQLSAATKKFSEKLGAGGFGTVYKGMLSDGTLIAVKQLERSGQGDKEFHTEVATVGSIHHVNLVRLYGFCSEGSRRLLVYEYLSGSLEKYIFNGRKHGLFLDWKTRFNIATDAARGISYLHEGCRKRIIHCDIKPQNILLTHDFSAKVSDFGMAKLMDRAESHVITNVRGTRGYLAPEWLMDDAPISEKCDVYSFGMLLLELAGGRKNYDFSASSSKLYFPDWVLNQITDGNIIECIDDRVGSEADIKEVKSLIYVALWCIQEEAHLRPSMGKVLQMLEGSIPIPDPPHSLTKQSSDTSSMLTSSGNSE